MLVGRESSRYPEGVDCVRRSTGYQLGFDYRHSAHSGSEQGHLGRRYMI